MIRAIAVIAAMVLVGCGSGGGGGSVAPEEKLPVSVRYVNGDPAAAAAAGVSLRAEEEESAIPMLFEDVKVRAYQFGATDVMVGAHGTDNISSWEIVPSAGGDLLLWDGGVADLPISFAEFVDQPEYVDQVGSFRFDAVFANGMPDLINANNSVCGGNNSGPSDSRWYNFPFLRFGVCQHKDVYSDEGRRIVFMRALFVRNDWVSEPFEAIIGSAYVEPTIWKHVCYTTTKPLSRQEEPIITDLMNAVFQDWPLIETGLAYDPNCLEDHGAVDIPLAVVPMEGPLAIAQLAQEYVPQPPLVNDDGGEIPLPDQLVVSSSLRVEIAWKVTPSMVVNYGEFNVDESDSDIILRPGPNGAPWGMTLRFVDTAATP